MDFSISRGVAITLHHRPHAIQERGAGAQMDRRTPRRLHLADRDQLISEAFQRLHHRLEDEVTPLRIGMPGSGKHATREVDRTEAERRLRRRGECRRHGVQEWQRDRSAQSSTHEGAARKMLFRDDHSYSLFTRAKLFGRATFFDPATLPASLMVSAGTLAVSAGSNLVRIWKGALSTIPVTTEDSR